MKQFATAALTMAVAYAKAEEDRVTYLPQMGTFDKYGAFSGMLPIEGTSKELHYLFFEAQNDSDNAPVLIWFNGGPGCSSMLAFMQENGPLAVDDGENFITENPHPWTERANVLWLESPAGVGWSIAGTDADLDTNDIISSQDALHALYAWYDKFPEFKKNKLFVSGESYAGIYVPYLSYQIY